MKRPMFLVGISILVTMVVNSFLYEKGIKEAGIIVLTVILLCFINKKVSKEVKIIFCMCAIASISFYIKTVMQVEPALKLKDKELDIKGVVLNQYTNKSGTKNLEINIEKIDEQNIGVKNKVLIKSYNKKSELKPGDVVKGKVSFKLPNNTAYFNAQDYYKSEDIFMIGYSTNLIKTSEKQDLSTYLGRVREGLAESTLSILPGDQGDFINAITLGYKKEFNEYIKSQFTYTGVSHIFALSGLHIGILGGFLLYIFRFFKLGKLSNILTLMFLLMYYLMIDYSTSMQRAVIMFSVFLIADIVGRYNDGLSSLGLALTIILLIHPYVIYSLGFMLSFSCILAIIICSKPIKSLISFVKNKMLKGLLFGILMSISITVFTLPIISFYFRTVNILSPFLNIVVIPIIAPLVILGFCMCFLSYIGLGFIGKALGIIIYFIYNFLISIIGLYSKYFTFHILLFDTFLFVFLTFVLIVLFCYLIIYKRNILVLKSIIAVLILVINVYYIYLMFNPNKITVLQNENKEDVIVGIKKNTIENVVTMNLKDEYSIDMLKAFTKNENIGYIHTLIIVNEEVDRYLLNRVLDFVNVRNILYNSDEIDTKDIKGMEDYYDVQFYDFADLEYSLSDDFTIDINIEDNRYILTIKLRQDTIVYSDSKFLDPSFYDSSFIIAPNLPYSKNYINSFGNSVIRLR